MSLFLISVLHSLVGQSCVSQLPHFPLGELSLSQKGQKKEKEKKKTPPLPCSRRSHPTNQKCFSHFQKPFLYQSIFIFTSLMPQAIILLSTLPYLYTQFWDSHSLLGSFLFFSFLILPYLGHPFFGFLSKKKTCDKSLLQGFCSYTPRVLVDCLKSVGRSLMKEKLDSSSLKRSL